MTETKLHQNQTSLFYKDLLFAWTSRILKARYQQSVLGGFWAILQPLATVLIFTTVFSFFLKVDTGDIPYIVFSYTAMVPWILFSSSINDMVESIVQNMNLVSKIYFPREILVVSALLARVVDFFIAYIILIILMIIFKIQIQLVVWLFLPVIILVELAFALGIGLIASALNAFYRDIRHLFVLLLQLWLYATPIIYPVSFVPEKWQFLYQLNPMVGIIEAYRSVMLHSSLPGTSFLVSALIAVIVLIIGYLFFKKVEVQFADII
ncbi:MAG: phosphate ABC transporter permease [Anaerolineaceae bacterium]|nr:phosphate ABC transporter permease [Anaerolineaceae bacterium]